MNPESEGKQKKLAAAARETGMANSGLSENAVKVLERRYLAKDKKGKVTETPSGMFRRVARNLSLAELGYGASEEIRSQVEEDFLQVMSRLEFLPNSPTLMNAGRELQQLSACFVLPIDDSLDSIFSTVKQTALIHKSGGGTGFSFSRLRPAGDIVGSTGGVASGPVSFIGAFDATTDVVKQGSTRRGANMAILNVDTPRHPGLHPGQTNPGEVGQLQHIGGDHRGVHGEGEAGRGVRPDQPPHRGGHWATQLQGGARRDRGISLGHRGPGGGIPGPDERSESQPPAGKD